MPEASVCGVDSGDEALSLERPVRRESSLDDIPADLLQLDEVVSQVP